MYIYIYVSIAIPYPWPLSVGIPGSGTPRSRSWNVADVSSNSCVRCCCPCNRGSQLWGFSVAQNMGIQTMWDSNGDN